MARLKRVGIFSAFKVLGFLYALAGLIVGAFVSLISLVGGALGGQKGGLIGLIFGAAAIIIFPILYGLLGAIGGAIGAIIYNVVARFTGGLEIELS